MISKVEVIVPYCRDSVLKRGLIFNFKSNNTLITGDNGVGKSSLLHMIFESLRINRDKTSGGNPLVFDYMYIQNYFDEGPVLLSDTRNRTFQRRFVEGDLSLGRVSYELLRNADLIGLKGIKSVLETKLRNLPSSNDLINEIGDEEFDNDVSNEFDYLKEISKLENIDIKFVYGVALQILDYRRDLRNKEMSDSCQITDISTPLTDFFYSKIIGKNLLKVPIYSFYSIPGEDSRKYGVLDESEFNFFEVNKSLSQGEFQKYALDIFLEKISDGGIVLLDEPMSNMSESWQDEYTNKILEASKNSNIQFIIASHDRLFNNLARSNNWNEVNLK